jgi:hypothetical protein
MRNKSNYIKAAGLINKVAKIREQLSRAGYNMSLKILPDFVECYARDRFNLKLTNEVGFDGIDKNNKKYQIKYTILKGETSTGIKTFSNALDNIRPGRFDFSIAVILDDKYEIIDLYKIPGRAVCKSDYLSKNRNFRFGKIYKKLDQYRVAIE